MDKITTLAGSTNAFIIFWVIIAGWLVLGKPLDWSDTWQLLINTPTTIVTTALGFAILHTQNRDAQALHAKLDAIIEFLDDNISDPKLEKFIRLEQQPERVIKETRDEENK